MGKEWVITLSCCPEGDRTVSRAKGVCESRAEPDSDPGLGVPRRPFTPTQLFQGAGPGRKGEAASGGAPVTRQRLRGRPRAPAASQPRESRRGPGRSLPAGAAVATAGEAVGEAAEQRGQAEAAPRQPGREPPPQRRAARRHHPRLPLPRCHGDTAFRFRARRSRSRRTARPARARARPAATGPATRGSPRASPSRPACERRVRRGPGRVREELRKGSVSRGAAPGLPWSCTRGMGSRGARSSARQCHPSVSLHPPGVSAPARLNSSEGMYTALARGRISVRLPGGEEASGDHGSPRQVPTRGARPAGEPRSRLAPVPSLPRHPLPAPAALRGSFAFQSSRFAGADSQNCRTGLVSAGQRPLLRGKLNCLK